MRDFETEPDCAVEGCHYAMTAYDIYCEGHAHMTIVTRSTTSPDWN